MLKKIKNKFKIFLKNKLAFVSFIFLVFLILMSFGLSLFNISHNPLEAKFRPFLPISAKHLMGTDGLGRDLFSRLMAGSRNSFTIAFCSVTISLFCGSFLGIIAGYFRGIFDCIINFFCDILIVIPSILIIILFLLFFHNGFSQLIIILSIFNILSFIRVVRNNTLTIYQNDFIKASKALGASNSRIIFKHILPGIIPNLMIVISISMSSVILSVAGLGYLGLGLDKSIPEWGSILSDGQEYIQSYPNLVFCPAFMILMTSLSFNLIGDGLSDIFDPKKQNI
ncbi:ABC-type dipeptide/ oligopeptide transport system, permease component II [Candidatus Phytoplasma mali]|uniref:ABC-type dipeptide/ oligopeptide transport system, permease component II n=1 Tax=Phytoplasma mali (strain AT) TaxID=482235 RepID=B3R089_PHYMT|nr:ABC transporter permease [Candidatus Phytoplasma mali]CAP18253.1 ABC-type dipeptide/ oligopeptide transport system, permease component II [Candidatus Phytoplasma mali]